MLPMQTDQEPARRVIVVGGGITGLAAAHRLLELNPALQVTLLESTAQLGGVIQTVRTDDYLIEQAPDSFITNIPWAVNLCQRIGFNDELIGTDETRRKALVVARGKLYPVPDGFLLMQPKRAWPVMASPILSVRGKMRLACEPLIRARRETGDESLHSFVARRLGQEAFDRLVQPLVGGIYTADPDKLSMAATLGRFQELERKHGSLMRAAWKDKPKPSEKTDSGARYSMFVAPKEGLGSLVQAIAARLREDTVKLNSVVTAVTCDDSQHWQVQLSQGETLTADGLIICTPAPAAAKMLESAAAALSRELAGIPYAGASVVVLAAKRDQIRAELNGFGFVVPAIENRKILAGSFSSLKFPGRAPDDQVLIRVFVGGALQPELAELPDPELIKLVKSELADLIGLQGEPLLTQVNRWQGAMPQYHVGHLDQVERIAQLVASQPGLELAGNAYRGVGIPQCIHSGEQAAERMAAYLGKFSQQV